MGTCRTSIGVSARIFLFSCRGFTSVAMADSRPAATFHERLKPVTTCEARCLERRRPERGGFAFAETEAIAEQVFD